jgi:hypothetical protein
MKYMNTLLKFKIVCPKHSISLVKYLPTNILTRLSFVLSFVLSFGNRVDAVLVCACHRQGCGLDEAG